MDKSAFEIVSLDGSGDRYCWRSKIPRERMKALERMRQIIYGCDPATARVQRVLEVAEQLE